MRLFVAPAIVLGLASAASAQVTLSANMTADNEFTAYISTSPTLEGTSFLSGNSWPSTFSGSTVLNDAGTYYLHVFAIDRGPPMMFIGDFTLDNVDATFQNGAQTLTTDAVNWVVSSTGFGDSTVAPADLGQNGASPWGSFALIDSSARYIWHPSSSQVAYFSTTITVVPAPAAMTSFAALGLVALRRRR